MFKSFWYLLNFENAQKNTMNSANFFIIIVLYCTQRRCSQIEPQLKVEAKRSEVFSKHSIFQDRLSGSSGLGGLGGIPGGSREFQPPYFPPPFSQGGAEMFNHQPEPYSNIHFHQVKRNTSWISNSETGLSTKDETSKTTIKSYAILVITIMVQCSCKPVSLFDYRLLQLGKKTSSPCKWALDRYESYIHSLWVPLSDYRLYLVWGVWDNPV